MSWHRMMKRPASLSPLRYPLEIEHDEPMQLDEPVLAQLSMYENWPDCDVDVEELLTWAKERVDILRELERCQAIRLDELATSQRVQHKLAQSDHLGSHDSRIANLSDEISHFVLRLALCRSDPLRDRYIGLETAYFRTRYASLNPEEQARFHARYKLSWPSATDDDKREHASAITRTFSTRWTEAEVAVLEQTQYARLIKGARKLDLLKLHWTDVPQLVGQRRAVITRGTTFVEAKHIPDFVALAFRRRMERALDTTARQISSFADKPELTDMFRVIQRLMAQEMSKISRLPTAVTLTAKTIDDVAPKHFPPCMLNLHTAMRRNKLLRYYGRHQYGTFLRRATLDADEATTFFRKAFSKTSAIEWEQKRYKYEFRYIWGLEGAGHGFEAKSCKSCIDDSPSQHEHHGCPFATFSSDDLSRFLSKEMDVKGESVIEILRLKEARQYQAACTRAFEAKHNSSWTGPEAIVDHPNRYFDLSLQTVQIDTD